MRGSERRRWRRRRQGWGVKAASGGREEVQPRGRLEENEEGGQQERDAELELARKVEEEEGEGGEEEEEKAEVRKCLVSPVFLWYFVSRFWLMLWFVDFCLEIRSAGGRGNAWLSVFSRGLITPDACFWFCGLRIS